MKSDSEVTTPRTVTLKTVFDCRRLLAKIINEHRQGKISDKQARTSGYLLQTMGTLMEKADLEARIVELEKSIDSTPGREIKKLPPWEHEI